jgi:hypothetical protein
MLEIMLSLHMQGVSTGKQIKAATLLKVAMRMPESGKYQKKMYKRRGENIPCFKAYFHIQSS